MRADLNEALLKAKLAQQRKNAKRREDNVIKAVAQGTDSKAVANLLRKGETLAYSESLFPFQQAAVLETVRNYRTGRHTLNASQVGLGKTRVAASFVQTVNFKRTLWITAKGNLTLDTIIEIISLGGTAIPLTDENEHIMLSMHFPGNVIFVTHYERIKRSKLINSIRWDCIIIDECSKLKGGAQANPTAIWKAAKDLCFKEHNKEAFRYFLSGTPAENRPDEVWSYLHILDPETFPNFYQFRAVFCRVNPMTGKPMVETEKLLSLLQGCVIRQTVKSLGLTGTPDLNDPQWFTQKNYEIELSPDSTIGQAYLSMQRDLVADLDGSHFLTPNMVLEQILRLRQLLTAGPLFTYSKQEYDSQGNPLRKVPITLKLNGPYPKLEAAEELIAKYQSEGEAVVVFSCFNEPLKNLHNALSRTGVYRSALMIGETSEDARNAAKAAFMDGTLDVLLINKMVGAKGLNLQKCDKWEGGSRVIIHLDRWWNPAIEEQANARCVRVNSTQPVVAYYLHVSNSIDDYMEELIEAKADHVGQLDRGLLRESLERFGLGSKG